MLNSFKINITPLLYFHLFRFFMRKIEIVNIIEFSKKNKALKELQTKRFCARNATTTILT